MVTTWGESVKGRSAHIVGSATSPDGWPLSLCGTVVVTTPTAYPMRNQCRRCLKIQRSGLS